VPALVGASRFLAFLFRRCGGNVGHSAAKDRLHVSFAQLTRQTCVARPTKEIAMPKHARIFAPSFAASMITAAVVVVAPAAAQQAPLTTRSQPAASEFCSGCFAYLEFSPSLEPESYAMRGQETETSTPLSVAGEPKDRLRNQKAGLLTSSKL
jgi:hypothetical protein